MNPVVDIVNNWRLRSRLRLMLMWPLLVADAVRVSVVVGVDVAVVAVVSSLLHACSIWHNVASVNNVRNN